MILCNVKHSIYNFTQMDTFSNLLTTCFKFFFICKTDSLKYAGKFCVVSKMVSRL